MFQMKEQYKTTETELNEMGISNSHAKKFKMTVIKLLTEVRRKKNAWKKWEYQQRQNI